MQAITPAYFDPHRNIDSSRYTEMQPTHTAIIQGFLLFTIALYLTSAIYWPGIYIFLTYEDLFGEWTQTLFFAVACYQASCLFFAKSRYRWFFLILATSCFYVAMEEISWGQRLFNIETPEFFKEHNQQREMNLHNLLTGPNKTGLKTFLEYSLSTAFLIYGLIYPLLLNYRFKCALWLDRLKIPAPPVFLAPYFLLAAFLEPEPFHFNEAEIAELLTAVALTLFTLHYRYAHKYQVDAHKSQHWEACITEQYRRSVWERLIMIPASAILITGISYQVSEMQHRIDRRLNNGYKKFARRYQSYQQWHTANVLLFKVAQKHPNDVANLRNIARNYQRMGNTKFFHKYNSQAIEISLRYHRKYPNNIVALLSLAKSYRQRGDQKNALKYGRKAYRYALGYARKKLKSSIRAYWLAQTMEFLGKYQEAYLQYRKAAILNPYSLKYRHAYQRSKRYLESSE